MTALTPMLATMLSMSHGGGVPVTAGPEAGTCTIRLGGHEFTVQVPQALAAANVGEDQATTLEDLLDAILPDEEPAAAKEQVAGEVADEDKQEPEVAENDQSEAAPSDEKPVEVADDAAEEQADLSLEELAARQGT